ncbi:MAG TPA: methyltransferase domain-containing protein [Candidatus Accumulibacter phosphatis]|nr:MAG: Trans-aconitate 2-methyltransferase [Candidatus Accumulibacter sp. SK-11]HAY27130.1 methyltransferase domain-containing protein [Accumulibacter sp.]HRL74519.1 methyltransferase domain-containing protein [Candidatus Accumulibacter phosphatis]HCN67812.1 methyltransferase domain-containing protein [Accumulibacter sp.]HCV13973.1 methyltransferase domain-containing protein [Accumulibacter sp.]
MSWNPGQYLKFADARLQPALDLLARLGSIEARRIVDLGCGAGNVTRLLADRWPAAEIVGVDSDAAMLARAASTLPSVVWHRADVASWRADFSPDLLFSNAVLHWLPDHRELLPDLVGQLGVDGVLAVQMPANFGEPAHQILRELADQRPWSDTLGDVRMGSVLPPVDYQQLLQPLCRRVDLWETTYWQVLSGDDAIIEWMRGTTLLPFMGRLDAATGERFLAAYRERLDVVYRRSRDGTTLFPFKRLFFVARR